MGSDGPDRPACVAVSVFYLLAFVALLAAGYLHAADRAQDTGGDRPFSLDGNPALVLLGVLCGSATLPLVMVSATAPLVQGWFA